MCDMTFHFKNIDLHKSRGCEHSDISEEKTYLVSYAGELILGKFSRQWYGWNFSWFGSNFAGLQLDWLSEVWEKID